MREMESLPKPTLVAWNAKQVLGTSQHHPLSHPVLNPLRKLTIVRLPRPNQNLLLCMSLLHNKGTGAGGAATNLHGKTFEQKTDNSVRLLEAGYVRHEIPGYKGKHAFYLTKEDGPRRVTYMTQSGLKAYFQHFHSKVLFRCPDEAYLIQDGDRKVLKILEKKNQNVAGSVDTKLLAGPGFLEEYKLCLGSEFQIVYGFCISEFLQKDYESETQKYKVLRQINAKYSIAVLFGDATDYFTKLDAWIDS